MANIILENSTTVFLLALFTLLCLSLFYTSKHSRFLDAGSMVALLGVIFGVIFFLFQNFSDIFSKIQALQISTVSNCELAKQIEKNPTDFYRFFNTDIYDQNPGFILNEFGTTTFQAAMVSKDQMNEENRLLEVIENAKGLNFNPPLFMFQQLQIRSKDLHTNLCDILEPRLLQKTKDFQEATLSKALFHILLTVIGIR